MMVIDGYSGAYHSGLLKYKQMSIGEIRDIFTYKIVHNSLLFSRMSFVPSSAGIITQLERLNVWKSFPLSNIHVDVDCICESLVSVLLL